MRTSAHIPGTLVLTALLAALPAAAIDDAFQTHSLTILEGPHDLEWEAAGVDQTEGQSAVDAAWMRLRVVNVPSEHTVLERPSGSPLTSNLRLAPPEVLEDRAVAGPATLAGHLRLLPALGELDLRTEGHRVHLGKPGLVHAESSASPYWGISTVAEKSVRPEREPPYTHVSTHAHLDTALDHVRVLVANGSADAAGRTYDLPSMRLNETRSHVDPVTGSGLYVYDNHILVLDVPHGHLGGVGTWDLQARAMHGHLDGHATWFGIQGELSVTEDHADDPTILEVLGELALRADLDSEAASWRVAGDATVLVDLEPRADASAVAIGGLGVLALAASLFTLLGRDLITFLLGRWTPSRIAADPLRSSTRRAILEAVHVHQPARLSDLEEATGLPRGTLRYHLRILEATHVLERDASGGSRHTTFALNGGSLRFRLADGGPTAISALSSAATHPVRRTILDTLLSGARDQDDLLDALRAAGTPVARSTLSHHLAKMVRAGIVEPGRDGRRKTYRAAGDPEELRRRQYHNFLRSKGLLAPARLLHSGSQDCDRFLEVISQTHPSTDSRRTLHRMEELRIVHVRDGRVRLAPAIQAALSIPGETP